MDGDGWMDEYGKFRWFRLCAGFDNLLSRMPAMPETCASTRLWIVWHAHCSSFCMHDVWRIREFTYVYPSAMHSSPNFHRARKLLFSLFLLHEWKMKKKTRGEKKKNAQQNSKHEKLISIIKKPETERYIWVCEHASFEVNQNSCIRIHLHKDFKTFFIIFFACRRSFVLR